MVRNLPASRLGELKELYFERWQSLPPASKEKLLRSRAKSIAYALGVWVKEESEQVKLTGPRPWHFQELTYACEHALGQDINVQVIGSRARGTAALNDHDMDIQVKRRLESKRANQPFTDSDMLRVASNLAKLGFVKNLTVGNIAIKFRIFEIMVDLVLWRERREEFPRLRGGNSFDDNTARINAFLADSAVARAAIVAFKSAFPRARPKGILIDSVAWRLAVAGEIPLTSRSEEGTSQTYLEKVFSSLLRMVEELVHWEWSPFFGRDLEQDLNNLSEAKKEKYLPGLEKVREKGKDRMMYELLIDGITVKACRRFFRSKGMQLLSADAAFEQTLRECFNCAQRSCFMGLAALSLVDCCSLQCL